jgi:hypothetical protein
MSFPVPCFPSRASILLRCAAFLTALPLPARAQSTIVIYPVANCIEYYTMPVPGYGNTGSYYVGNWGAANLTGDVYLKPGIPQNFFSPGQPTVTYQPYEFPVGYIGNYRIPQNYLYEEWYILGNTAVMYGPGNSQGIVPTPACSPAFVPAANLVFAQPGTYTQQFVGQVNAGPPASQTGLSVAVNAFSATPAVTLANVTYVPSDPANPTSDVNPNSVYADITISGAPGNSAIFVQLTQNGVAVVFGTTPIAY